MPFPENLCERLAMQQQTMHLVDSLVLTRELTEKSSLAHALL